MKYCSSCGSPDLVLEVPPGDNRPRYTCKACGQIFYANPKIVAGCLVVHQGRVLLCRRSIEPMRGFWNLPSGYLENGEKVEDGALREVLEEAEAQATLRGVHCLYSLPHINQVYIHFLADLKGEHFAAGHETLEAKFFSEDEIPWDHLAFSSSTYSLQQYFSDLKAGQHTTHIGSYEK